MDAVIKTTYALSDTLVIATHNAGKMVEFRGLLQDKIPNLEFGGELGLEDVEETGTTFHENSALKAVAAMRVTGKISVGDDSGLAVEALDGAPGVYSARWAEDEDRNRDFYKAMDEIWDKIKDSDNHRAYFITVLALAFPDGHVEYIEGRVYGTIVYPARGGNGFGYDPIFQPDGEQLTFGEMTADAKQSISHRASALRQFVEQWC